MQGQGGDGLLLGALHGQAVDELAQRHHAVVQGLQARRFEHEKLIRAYGALF